MKAVTVHNALTVGLVISACSTPEKQLESGRRYMSINYNDTTIESFSRTDRAITGLVVHESDSVRFRIMTNPDALVSEVDITVHPATSSGEHPHTRRIGMPKGTMPVMGTTVAFLEQLLRRARVAGGDSVSLPVMLLGAQASLEPMMMIHNGRDSVVLVGPDGNAAIGVHLAVDEQGRILGGLIPLSSSRILSLDTNP